MDLTHAKRIGLGRTAEVYAWDDGRVLKLFHAWAAPAWVEHERGVTAAAHAAGLPAPAVFGPEVVGDRHGFVLERVEGPSQLQALQARPWRVVAVGRQLAEVHAALHARTVPGLRPLREKLREDITRAELPGPLEARAQAALARMPDGDAVCHGDLHPDNVVLTGRGPVVLDWSEAAAGHPLADVARSSLMLRIAGHPQGSLGPLLLAGRRLLHAAYLRRYLALTGGRREALAPFLLPVAAARASHRIEDERPALLAWIARLAG